MKGIRPTLLAALAPVIVVASTADAGDPVDFNTDVRPILSRHCLICHGPDVSSRKAGLRLDERPDDDVLAALIERVAADHPDDRMPPAPRPAVSPDEIDLLRRWIDEGASYAVPWAWAPIEVVPPPEVADPDWAAHPVDRFIRARLDAAGLTPAGPAEPSAQIRRLAFDLLGVPPDPAEVAAFVADDAPDAWERLVDRWLDDARFGERWARHWLDLVRYAETHGHEFDYPIHHAWRYRDYVIRAFNDDVPYDDLVTEHIAGDLLETPRRHPDEGFDESIIGTGFWFLSQGTHAPVDVKADEAERIDNQIDVLGKTFLGVTVSCARCHDHKFDPISTADFYALNGFLQSSRRQEAYLDPGGRIAASLSKLQPAVRSADAIAAETIPRTVPDFTPVATAAHEVLANTPPPKDGKDEAAKKAHAEAREAELTRVAEVGPHDRDALAKWTNALPAPPRVPPAEPPLPGELFEGFDTADAFDRWFEAGHAFSVTGPREVALRADGPRLLPPGVAHSGRHGLHLQGTVRSETFEIDSEFIVYRLSGRHARVRLIIDGYYLDEYNALLFNGMKFDVNSGEHAWYVHAQHVGRYKGHRAYIELIDDGNGFLAVDEIRFSDARPPDPAMPPPYDADTTGDLHAAVDDALAAWHDGTLTPHASPLVGWLVAHGLLAIDDDRLTGATALAADIDRSTPGPMRVLALTDGTPEDEHVFIRGSHRQPGELVPRRFIDSLHPNAQTPIESGSGRLELARRLLAPENPLPARVAVNRVWGHLFGEGIVPTPDDFGGLGQPPSHPELLDWLAAWYRDDADWSTKRLVRLLVTSRAYRMSSVAPEGDRAAVAAIADPANRLLHHARVRRLQAEAIRDALLTVSGRLDPTMYGPPVPVHLTPFLTGRGRPGRSGPLDGDGRRSIYIAVRRNFRAAMMTAFDAPVPASTVGHRSRSNVPAQALMLMNDPFVESQAKLWAERVRAEEGLSDEQRIDRMYRRAFARPPRDVERRAALEFLSVQPSWSDLAHVLLNTKEFIFLP